jgi:opacity protein-like surface antigen
MGHGALDFSNLKGETIMRRLLVFAGLLLLWSTTTLAQDYPKFETSPGFMFIRTNLNLQNTFVVNGQTVTGAKDLNCAGGGGTIAYNFSSMIGLAADLGGCKIFGNTYGAGNTVSGSEFTYLFGPRFTYRNSSRFEPFAELNFGGLRAAVTCQSSANACVTATNGNSYSRNAFALTVGGGFQVKMSKKISLRLIQLEYMYSRLGNSCALAACNNNANQNSLRLKSGIVLNW